MVAVGPALDDLDGVVDTFREAIGDAVSEEGEDALFPSSEAAGHGDEGCQTALGAARDPVFEEGLRVGAIGCAIQRFEVLSEQVGFLEVFMAVDR